MIEVEGQICETSPAVDLIARLVRAVGKTEAHRVVDEYFDALSNVDGAALAHDWSFWARPKQHPTGEFVSCLYLTGRGFGKTYGISRWINEEVEAGRVRAVGLAAQDEANSVFLQVLGPSGLIATAPPWHRPEWEASSLQLVWPNGARAYVRTPEVPGKIRGYDYDLAWLSELQSWPAATRDEALSNFRLATRLGAMRMIFDATPKRRHPLLLRLLADCQQDSVRYREIRGTTHENAINLADGYMEELQKQYGGTLKGREELLGEMLAESDSAQFRQGWIDRNRVAAPAFVRRVVSVDPAVTNKKGSDTTGIVTVGLGADGRVYVTRDDSGKLDVAKWADIALDRYVYDECDLILAETNKGGQLVVQNLRAAAKDRRLTVVVIGKEDRPPPRLPGTVFVREVYAQGSKSDRAEPVATAYEKNRVSHVLGADLVSLEDTLTTWEPSPGAESPGDLDALVHAVVELLDLTSNRTDPRTGFTGIVDAQRTLTKTTHPASPSLPLASLSTLLAPVHRAKI